MPAVSLRQFFWSITTLAAVGIWFGPPWLFNGLLFSYLAFALVLAIIVGVRDYRAAKASKAPPTGPVVGGLYAELNDDGQFTLFKVLAIDFGLHVRIYQGRFPQPPLGITSATLTASVGHAPCDLESWRESNVFLGQELVSEAELEGYRLYLST